MTSGDPANEQVAQRLASRGRDALVERLRQAYAQAAETHADVLSIDSGRLETIVQGAAERADGLQWRRALADVASGELGISLTDALAHPAVTRAQELAGAPSYEASLAALGRHSVPLSSSSYGSAAPEAEPEPEAVGEPEPEPAEPEPQAEAEHEPKAEAESERASEEPPPPWHSMTEHHVAESQTATIVQPAPHRFERPAPPAEAGPPVEEALPAGADEPEDPDATREWSAPDLAGHDEEPHDLAGDDEEPLDPPAALPPRPTHAVPAPPPETSAGGHQAAPRLAAAATAVDGPAWVPDEPAYEDDPRFHDSPVPHAGRPDPDEAPDRLRVSAIHLGGVANVPTNHEGIDIRLSAHGLDIMRADDNILGRLGWAEIDALEVPSPRVRRRRNRDRARLIIRTAQGDATFEVPGFSSDELHERIVPLVDRFAQR